MTSSDNDLAVTLRQALHEKPLQITDDDPNRKPAAVLIPFVRIDNKWHLLFTKRTHGVGKHRGEISFPGGAAEEWDSNLIETAVRETCEEIGIPKARIHILGVLDPIPTVSNYCILPVVSILDWPQPLQLNKDEVDNILLIPVDWLKEKENWYQDDFFYEPGKYKTVIHYKDFEGEHLWGVTARLAQIVISYL